MLRLFYTRIMQFCIVLHHHDAVLCNSILCLHCMEHCIFAATHPAASFWNRKWHHCRGKSTHIEICLEPFFRKIGERLIEEVRQHPPLWDNYVWKLQSLNISEFVCCFSMLISDDEDESGMAPMNEDDESPSNNKESTTSSTAPMCILL